VLEKYLFGKDGSYLLSQKIKLAIHRGDLDNRILDPYILMFEEVYEYYSQALEDKELLKILRQNLYLKINPQLTKYAGMKNSKNLPYKVTAMSRYVLDWKWSAGEIKDLDNFDNWDYRKIMQLWNQVKKFMLLTYQKIARDLPAMNLAQHISESDFMLLSRKIKTYFSSNEGEIDNYVTFKDTPYESILYIEPMNAGIKDLEWRLYKRDTSSKDTFQSTTLKTKGNLVKLLAWTALNQIFDPTFSRIQIQSGYTRINQNLILGLLTEISNLFNRKDVHVKNEFYLSPAFTIKNMLIINFNQENTEILNSIYHLHKTSWGQSYIHHYTDPEQIVTILETVLTDGLKLRLPYDEYCAINTPEPFKKQYKHVDRLFRDAYAFLVADASASTARFITRTGKHYIDITRDGNKLKFTRHANFITLLASITLSPRKKADFNFYGDDPQIMVMKSIWDKRRGNSISVIFETRGEHSLIYVINEGGNIFNFIVRQEMRERALVCLYEFLKNIIAAVNRERSIPGVNDVIEVLGLTQKKTGEISFSNESSFIKDLHLLKFQACKPMAAVINRHDGKEFQYCVKSSLEATDFTPLGALGPKVKALKKPQNTVPYISGIEFNDLKKTDLSLGTTIYLVTKYRLESIIAKFQ
jgi:adenylate cyclase